MSVEYSGTFPQIPTRIARQSEPESRYSEFAETLTAVEYSRLCKLSKEAARAAMADAYYQDPERMQEQHMQAFGAYAEHYFNDADIATVAAEFRTTPEQILNVRSMMPQLLSETLPYSIWHGTKRKIERPGNGIIPFIGDAETVTRAAAVKKVEVSVPDNVIPLEDYVDTTSPSTDDDDISEKPKAEVIELPVTTESTPVQIDEQPPEPETLPDTSATDTHEIDSSEPYDFMVEAFYGGEDETWKERAYDLFDKLASEQIMNPEKAAAVARHLLDNADKSSAARHGINWLHKQLNNKEIGKYDEGRINLKVLALALLDPTQNPSTNMCDGLKKRLQRTEFKDITDDQVTCMAVGLIERICIDREYKN